jgi:hypothetical protein
MRKPSKKMLFLFVSPLLVPAAIFFMQKSTCSRNLEVSIGNYLTSGEYASGVHSKANVLIGRRASLKQLAFELKRCPQAQQIRILRNNRWYFKEVGDPDATFYDRNTKTLIDYEEWGNVTDQAIHKVASTSGDFKDLEKYGAIRSPLF